MKELALTIKHDNAEPLALHCFQIRQQLLVDAAIRSERAIAQRHDTRCLGRLVEMGGMEVCERMADVGRRKEGILWVVKRWVERASWSKMLRSLSWTRKMTQSGKSGECLEEP